MWAMPWQLLHAIDRALCLHPLPAFVPLENLEIKRFKLQVFTCNSSLQNCLSGVIKKTANGYLICSRQWFLIVFSYLPLSVDTAPVLVGCPNDTVVGTSPGLASGNFTWELTVEDEGSMPGVVNTTESVSPGVFQLGDTFVQINATDSLGNVGECSFLVTVIGESHFTLNGRWREGERRVWLKL